MFRIVVRLFFLLVYSQAVHQPLGRSTGHRIAIVSSDAGPNPDGANGCSDRERSQFAY
ncbi:hypothetical protein B0H19DRAFT_1275113 [Mycena capillaripes]|nr:hypothetical protein B0H19DRAFT_1275113 [Mycena capillaripes]